MHLDVLLTINLVIGFIFRRRCHLQCRPIIQLGNCRLNAILTYLRLRAVNLRRSPKPRLRYSENLELVRTVFVEEGYGDTHDARIVDGYGGRLVHLYCVVVVVSRIVLLIAPVAAKEDHLLVARLHVEVGEPADALDTDVSPAVLVDAASRGLERIAVGDKELPVPRVDASSDPHLVVHKQREEHLGGDGAYVADDEEPLVVGDERRNVVAEEAEGRVGDHDVRLIEETEAFPAPEVSRSMVGVAVQFGEADLAAPEESPDVLHGEVSVAILVLHGGDDGLVGPLLAVVVGLFRPVSEEAHLLPCDG